MSSKFLPHFQPRAMQNVKATPLGASPPALREAEKNQQRRGLNSRSSCCFPPPARRQAASPPGPPRRPLSANCASGGGLGPLGSGQEIIRQSAIIPLSPVASAIEGGGGGGTTVGRVLLENDL